MLDAYLGRPEGLVWSPDWTGLPAYMAGLSPTLSFTLPSTIVAGQNITINFPAAAAGLADLIGEVFILDRTNAQLCEAVTVSAVDTVNGRITFQKVAQSHAQGATMEAGLVIAEERPLAPRRSLTRAMRAPLVRLLSGIGRYSYGRRSQDNLAPFADLNLLATMQVIGGPPVWTPFDVTQASISVTTGEIWIPVGLLLAYYSDVRIRYVAGYSAAGLPPAVKQACATLLATLGSGNYDPAFKVQQAGGTRLERWADSLFDPDTKAMLDGLKPRVFA
ncbi:hypothetical protein [Sphingomonas sp.]|uniref:hypothetical protein n=1 Tax=Sphingomonas sp. TaxID=28214 RepID=UPI0025F1234C|nr:hypothetical protein [Sphingomonas sp.]MBV9528250.1 hypothetical protein [Sphingomonas sp.]